MVDFQDWEVGSQKRTGTEFFVADKFEILDSMLPSADKINIMPAGKGKRCKRPGSISVIQAANSELGADR